MWSIDELQEVWQLASKLHNGQKYGDRMEYLNHIGSVTFEILNAVNHEKDMNADLAIKCAILHDSIEDTEQSFEDVKMLFGQQVAHGVMALTKNEGLEGKEKMMLDSLSRIQQQPKEIWAVKMADRICNLQKPPAYWTNQKKIKYQKEAQLIHKKLKDGNKFLAARLERKINEYVTFIE
ncbi:MAG: HD domain-containing protein [Saprospiraceae bacterium]|nr:HD domain-containing protein [Saprospiraceae bacterium]